MKGGDKASLRNEDSQKEGEAKGFRKGFAVKIRANATLVRAASTASSKRRDGHSRSRRPPGSSRWATVLKSWAGAV